MILSSDYIASRVIASVPTIMYHGTNIRNKSIVLSQGLIPSPKKRKWSEDKSVSFYTPSRQSLGGIYLTTNLLTAISSGTESGGGGACLLVVVLVQSGNLLADEDDFKYILNEITLPGLSANEWLIMRLYAEYVAISNNLIKEDWRRQEVEEEIIRAKNHYISGTMGILERKITVGLTPQEKSILQKELEKGFGVALKRKASTIDASGWGYEEVWGVKRPNPAEAEAEYKALEDRLTRVLKRVGRPEFQTQRFSQNSRIETPIGYSGKNKILAVVEVKPYQKGMGTQVEVLYPPSKEVPEKLIEDWETHEGEWRPVHYTLMTTPAGDEESNEW